MTTTAARYLRDGRVRTILAVIAVKALLDLSYALVVPSSGYYALLRPTLAPVKLVESYVLLLLTVLSLPLSRPRPATMFLLLVYLISFVPMLSVYPWLDESRPFTYVAAGFWMIVAAIVRWMPTPRLPELPATFSRRAAIAIYLAIGVTAVAVLIAYSGTSTLMDVVRLRGDLSGAYANRAEFVGAHLPINGYYFHWLAVVLNPLLAAWLLVKRGRWLLLLVPIFVFQLFDAAVVGARAYIGALPFVLLILLCVRRGQPMLWIAGVVGGMVAAGPVVFLATRSGEAFNFLTGRFLLLPAQLTYMYYEFFSRHGLIPGAYLVKYYLHLPVPWPYPYDRAPDFVIGYAFYHEPNLDAVGGILADAYMNFGYIGLPLFAVALGLLIKLIDAVGEGLDDRLVLAPFVMPATSIAGTFFIRVLFTTGLLWGLVVLYLLSQAARGLGGAGSSPAALAADGADGGLSRRTEAAQSTRPTGAG